LVRLTYEGTVPNAIRTATLTTGTVNVAYPWVGDPLVVPYPSEVIDVTAKTPAQISTEYTEKITWFNTVNFTGASVSDWVNYLPLNIPEGKTVEWEATVNGNVSMSVILLMSASRGTFIVKGGSIQNSGGGSSIHSDSPGTIIVSGGTVRHTANGVAISNKGNGTVNVTDGLVTSATNSTTFGTIENDGTGKINVSGGTVSNTSTGVSIWNAGAGTVVTVSGTAVVSATTSADGAIRNVSTGTINIEGGTVTSAITTSTSGTIRNSSAGGTVNVSGGIVQNTATSNVNRRAIHSNNDNGVINVTGGVVQLTEGAPNYDGITSAIRGGTINVTPPGVVIPWN